jgi:glycosyltransferase involved in cell wall biosynthesis
MRKIRVAFFADMIMDKHDGYSRTIQQLLRHIPSERFDFLFITGHPTMGLASKYKTVCIPSVVVPSTKHYKMAIPHFSKYRLKQILDTYQPDIIHLANPSPLGKFGTQYALKHNIPAVSIYHTHYIGYVKYFLRKVPLFIPYGERYVSQLNKEIYDTCDIVYVPVHDISKELKARGFNTNHYKLWQRGIDVNIFHPKKKDTTYIRNLTQNNKVNILFASRIVWEKNLDTLIDIYHKIDLKKFNFIIAGEGVALDALKEKMPQAFFLGNLDHVELSRVYASSDLFLFPSDTETFGNVVLEAMASGCPVIAANAGGPTGLIDHEESGFLCASHNADDYIQRIYELAFNDELRTSFIEKALHKSAQFSWDHLANIYFEDLESLRSSKQALYA